MLLKHTCSTSSSGSAYGSLGEHDEPGSVQMEGRCWISDVAMDSMSIFGHTPVKLTTVPSSCVPEPVGSPR